MSEKLKSALEILKELEQKQKVTEVKIKTKEIDVILIDYREQLRRYDVFALGFDYVLYFTKNNEAYREKLEKIIEALERMRPVRARLVVKVDQVPTPTLDLIESITGDVVDIKEFDVIENVLNEPIFVDKGIVSLSRAGSAKIRTDGSIFVINDTTRNGERIKVLAQRGGVEVLFTYARKRNSGGYAVIEGIYFLPLEDVRRMIEENEAAAVVRKVEKEIQKLEQENKQTQKQDGQGEEEKIELDLH